MEIKGINKLLKKLDNLKINIDIPIKKALDETCYLIEGEAKLNCPVDKGLLRNSINHVVEKIENDYIGVVGTNVEYAPYVEFGTGIVGNSQKPPFAAKLNVTYRDTPWIFQNSNGEFRYTSGQRPQPFLYPAYQKYYPELSKIISERLKQSIQKEAKR